MDAEGFASATRNTDRQDLEYFAATVDSDTRNLELLGVSQIGTVSFP